ACAHRARAPAHACPPHRRVLLVATRRPPTSPLFPYTTLFRSAPTVNTIALFYDVRALDEAGIAPPRTWAELREAAAALTAGRRYGIAFCGNATYEGAWQYLPFFWTNGADERDITSPEAAQALGLLTDLVTDRSASTSVLNWGQVEVKDQFISGR